MTRLALVGQRVMEGEEMFKIVFYAIGFFLLTLLLQYLLHKVRKNGNRGKGAVWVGRSAAIVICIMGGITQNINYLGAVLGFLMADEIGKQMGWQ